MGIFHFVVVVVCLGPLRGMWDPYFPDQGVNLYPLQWKHGILTTGLPQKSLVRIFQSVCL